MSAELLNKVNKRLQTAVSFHRESADLYWFIYLPGFAMMHEYQNLSELFMQRKIKRYISTTYNTVAPDKIVEAANIIEPLIKGKQRFELSATERWTAVKESFKAYQNWEENTIKDYQDIALELIKTCEISSFEILNDIITDTKKELTYLRDMIIDLNGMDWDMIEISSRQSDYFERFEYLIKNILGKSEYFHHWNSAQSYEDRTSVFDKKE